MAIIHVIPLVVGLSACPTGKERDTALPGDTEADADADLDADTDADSDSDTDTDTDAEPADYSLADAHATFWGDEMYGLRGMTLASGDLDGDGAGDVILGAPNHDDPTSPAYVLLGLVSGDLHPSDADATLTRADGGCAPGFGGEIADNMLGDGRADIVLFGHDLWIAGWPVLGGDLCAAYDTHISSTAWDEFGDGAAVTGDIDGNGTPDLLVNAWDAALVIPTPVDGEVLAEEVATATLLPEVDLEDPDVYWYRRGAVAAPGDMDGDGVEDFLISTPNWDDDCSDGCGRGIVYVLSGPVRGEIDLEREAVAIMGEERKEWDRQQWLGETLVKSGDLDGDGHADFLVTGNDSVEYLVPGPVARSTVIVDVGIVVGDEAGGGIPGDLAAGDVDGDGQADLLVGHPYDEYPEGHYSTGQVALYLGPILGPLGEEDADVAIHGVPDSTGPGYAGSAISTPFDVDGDGTGDFWIGADYLDGDSFEVGAAHLVLAGDLPL